MRVSARVVDAAHRTELEGALTGQAAEQFELSVTNAGPDIPPAVQERLFEPFVRGEVTPQKEGLGLGLYIAWQIAQAHGGTLKVHSLGGETRFTFRMPMAQ